MRPLLVSIALFATTISSSACDGPCSDVAAEFGIEGNDLNSILAAFMAAQQDFPSGVCGANASPSINVCMQEPAETVAALQGFVCLDKPIATKDATSREQAPFSGQERTISVRVPPFAGFSVKGKIAGKVKSMCDISIRHVHTGRGLIEDAAGSEAGDGTTQKNPDTFLNRQVLAIADLELEATADVEASYTKNGVPATVAIDAGDSCTSTNFVFNRCRYAQDGHACNVRGEVTLVDPDSGGEPGGDVPPSTDSEAPPN